jgi:chemotaxis protein CheC
MEMTPHQQDALTELINIAFARTASSLSELTGNRVEIEVPEVSIHPPDELAGALAKFVQGDVATVHQIFTGPVAGDALLLLNHDGAVNLANLLTQADPPLKRLASASKEVLTEVGNILLNSCLGIFGDILQVRFSFTVPRLQLEALGELLDSFVIEKDELQQTLVVGAKFHLETNKVTGCLVIVLGVTSLSRLMNTIENWAEVSTGAKPGSKS